MKSWTLAIIFLFLSVVVNAKDPRDLTWEDLEGFDHRSRRTILKYKDFVLPEPVAPEEGGITTGAVFILGRYIPPPYEVTVDGPTVRISGVPCTNFPELMLTDEERAENHRRAVIGDVEAKLKDAYQRGKWYEGAEAALPRMEEALGRLEDVEKRGVLTETDPATGMLAKVTVRLNHQKIGEFEVEVESEKAWHGWMVTYGHSEILSKAEELLATGGSGNIVADLEAYARSLPWVESFYIQDGDIRRWVVNGEAVRWGCIQPTDPLMKERTKEEVERIAYANARASASYIQHELRENLAVFFVPGKRGVRNSNKLQQGIREIQNSAESLFRKRVSLVQLLRKHGMSKMVAEGTAEFLTIYGNSPGDVSE